MQKLQNEPRVQVKPPMYPPPPSTSFRTGLQKSNSLSAGKQSLGDFWQQNLTTTGTQPKVGWDYNKIVCAKTREDVQNTINKYRRCVENSLNDLEMQQKPSSPMESYKLRKNLSFSHLDSQLHAIVTKPAPLPGFYSHSNSAFTPVGSYKIPDYQTVPPINSLYSITKSFSNVSVPTYVNAPSHKPSQIPLRLTSSSNQNDLSTSCFSQSLAQNLSKSSSNSCIYSKALKYPEKHSLITPYKSFWDEKDVRITNKMISKNTDRMKMEQSTGPACPAVSLKSTHSFSNAPRPNVIFQKPSIVKPAYDKVPPPSNTGNNPAIT